ncbi:MAG: scyllo-inositol 2-dehydrogenase (NAD(+)) [Acidobacteria bacterium]|nr:scyllo-inositol 2-dehydrogenase (NAD(+)) [Acidobacteriota bacterium]
MNKINVGLIGVGRLGVLYARYLAYQIPASNLIAASDVNPAAEAAAKELGVKKWYSNYQDLIDDKQVDAVVIVTPTSNHRDTVTAAARAGKAIFCEKPLSISLDEARAMQKVVEETGVFFHMGFMRRFDRGFRAGKQKVEEGAIGKAVVFKASSRDPFRPSLEYLDPNHSGGLIIDMGIHDIDIARWMMGDVAQTYATGGVLAYPEINEVGDIDNAIVNLTFENGALGVIDLTRNGVYGYDIRTEVLGTQGTVKVGYLRETPIVMMTKDGVTHDTVPWFMERFGEAYVAQLQNFIEHLQKQKEPSIKCADGVEALRVAIAATRAFKENRPVAVAEIV